MKHYIETIGLYFELKGSPESTKEKYWSNMKTFLSYMEIQDKPIEDLSEEDIQQFILYLKRERNLSPGTINNYISALRFFYTYVLEREWNAQKYPRMKRVQTPPVIPPKEDILLLLNSTKNLKHKTMFALMYGSGLRAGEVAKLKIRHICSKGMRVRIENAKHNTNRYTILSHTALELLRNYFRQYFANINYTSESWLFPGGKNPNKPIYVQSINKALIKSRNKLQLDSTISAHTLRHCFATHALEDGIDPVFIQQMLGHKKIQTTLAYLHMTSKSLMGVQSPLDHKDSFEK